MSERRTVQHWHLVGDRNPTRRWTLSRMVESIKDLKRDGLPVNISYLLKYHNSLGQAIGNWPGGWMKVVSEADLDPAKERGRPRRPRAR